MQLFKYIPDWVDKFPVESERHGLLSVAMRKGSLAQPREMNFVLAKFTSSEYAEEAAYQVAQNGWKGKVDPDADDPEFMTVIATKDQYSITEETFIDDLQYFYRIAKLYDAVYDGWFASVPMRKKQADWLV
jgi:hypothetical protein